MINFLTNNYVTEKTRKPFFAELQLYRTILTKSLQITISTFATTA